MALTAGNRLGPYEVLAPLGAGAMGEVYRARDTAPGSDGRDQVLAEFARTAPLTVIVNWPAAIQK